MKSRKKQNNNFMKKARKPFGGKKQKLPMKTILLATSGDPDALIAVVDIYQPYIKELSRRVIIDSDGQYKEIIDETVKRTLETGLIAAIMKFNPYR